MASAKHKPTRKPKSKSIPDPHARVFYAWLDSWVNEKFKEPDGEYPPDAQIAKKLGVTPAEYRTWVKRMGTPGIGALLKLHKKTGHSIDEMLGLK